MIRVLPALAVVSALLLPAAAFADTVSNFDVSGDGLALSFSLPTSPTPDGHDPHQDFYIGDLSFTENGQLMTADNVYFYNKTLGGGFELTDSNGNAIDGLDFFGPKLFTGTDKKPTFKQGDFNLTGGPSCVVSADAGAGKSCVYALDITRTTTPEPSSLLLLGSGTLGAVNLLRRRMGR